jgi:hypothetical protein
MPGLSASGAPWSIDRDHTPDRHEKGAHVVDPRSRRSSLEQKADSNPGLEELTTWES